MASPPIEPPGLFSRRVTFCEGRPLSDQTSSPEDRNPSDPLLNQIVRQFHLPRVLPVWLTISHAGCDVHQLLHKLEYKIRATVAKPLYLQDLPLF